MQEQLRVLAGPGAAGGAQSAVSEPAARRAKPSEAGRSNAAGHVAQSGRSFSAIFAVESDKAAGPATGLGKPQLQTAPPSPGSGAAIPVAATEPPGPALIAADPSRDPNVMPKPSSASPPVAAARRQALTQLDHAKNDKADVGTKDHDVPADPLVAVAQPISLSISVSFQFSKAPSLSMTAIPSGSHEDGADVVSAAPATLAQPLEGTPVAAAMPLCHLQPSKEGINSQRPAQQNPEIGPTTPNPAAMTGFPPIALPPASGAVQPAGVVAAQQLSELSPPRISLPDQIAPAVVHLSTIDGARHISLQLTPSNLGMVDIQIDQPNSGPTTITLTVQHPETLAILHKDIDQLGKVLGRAGFDGADQTISLQLAPAHAALPPIDPGSQGSHSNSQHPPSSGGAWQDAAFAANNGFQTPTGTSDQHRGPASAWHEWQSGPAPDDTVFPIVPSVPSSHYRAGLNITA